MREIKFRGKRIDNGEWIYGSYFKHQMLMPCPIGHVENETDYEHLIIRDGFADWNLPRRIEAVAVDPETVGQFIDLHDKNGKYIYKGDIVQDQYGVGEIKWMQEHCAFMVRTIKPHAYHYLESDGKLKNTEVIGNIHDNPELLK